MVYWCRGNIEVWFRILPFFFKLYSYLILFMDGTINGLDTMSSFGESHSSLAVSWILHDNYICYWSMFIYLSIYVAGTWLCLWYHLFAMWLHSHSLDCYSISLPHPDKIVGLTHSSSWWLWFSFLCLLLSRCTQQWVLSLPQISLSCCFTRLSVSGLYCTVILYILH